MNSIDQPATAKLPATKYFSALAGLLIAMYVSGFIGLQIDLVKPLFLYLVPYNLLASTLILLLFHTDWNKSFIFFLVLCFLAGYWIEVIGVKTGFVFGQYQYGDVLGLKVLRVPLLIGVNWLMLLYAIGSFTSHISQLVWVKVAIGALMMVALDVLIEPVAIALDFWHWQSEGIPLQNYVAWFMVSGVLLACFHSLKFGKSNQLAGLFYFVQLGFFALHNVVYLL